MFDESVGCPTPPVLDMRRARTTKRVVNTKLDEQPRICRRPCDVAKQRKYEGREGELVCAAVCRGEKGAGYAER